MKEKLQQPRSEDLPGVVEDEEVNFNKRYVRMCRLFLSSLIYRENEVETDLNR